MRQSRLGGGLLLGLVLAACSTPESSINRGPEWVRDTLRELRATENYERNFWTLLANRKTLDESFSRESAGYVPSFFAVAIIGENPEVFGLEMPPLSTLADSHVSK